MAGIYIHIPFCKQACSYCDFYFVTQTKYRRDFVDHLVSEIEYRGSGRFRNLPIQSVYFGGGTPSLLAVEEVQRILDALDHNFQLEPKEVTFEMNPDDVTADYLQSLGELGVTRASMGVQSFQPELLNFLHRAHSAEEALRCLELLSAAPFHTFTVDLIYGNPEQTFEQLDDDLTHLLEFDPPHVSAYQLTIESGTRLGKLYQLGRLDLAEDEEVNRQFDRIVERLGEADIQQYEVSNYAQAGHEAIHNSNYWNHKPYLGLGPGAHSFWYNRAEGVAQRWENKADLRHYLKARPGELTGNIENLSTQQLAEERLMLGLRTREGVSLETLSNQYRYPLSGRQKEYLQAKAEEGFLEYNDRLRLTQKGLKIANAILLDLVTLYEK